jgi:septum formation inhibitor MinC
MGKLLKILGVSEKVQKILPKEVLQGEELIDALQKVYSQAPESPKKSQLALAISESVRILLAKVQGYKIEEKKEDILEEEDKKLPEIDKETPPEEKPKKSMPTAPKPPPPPTPPKNAPESPKQTEEPMTCEEIKESIIGLTLLAKMGDDEAKDIIKQLKNKLKTQNCK